MSAIRNFIYMLSAPFRWLSRLGLSAPGIGRRMAALSVPARISFLLGLFLFVAIVAAAIFRWLSHGADFWADLGGMTITVIFALLFVIPFVCYHALRLWLQGEVSPYSDIEDAWNEGIAALNEQGLDPNDIPIFLIVGAENTQQVDVLMQSADFDFQVQAVPAGRAPLRWFASDRAIFLACPGAGCLSRLNSQPVSSGGSFDARGTLVEGGSAEAQPSITGTMVADSAAPSIRGSGPASDGVGASTALRGTLIVGEPDAGDTGSAAITPPSLGPREMDEESDRLSYVCQLIRQLRQPTCAINGTLTVLPLKIIEDVLVSKNMPEAIRRDLDSIVHTTKLHAPVTALVTGMQNEPGFSELVRRLGEKDAKASRFGKGFDVWNPPTEENLDALSSHACGAFEDWVYNLFRKEDGLNKAGNGKLYMMLCNMRSKLQRRLRNIIVRGFSLNEQDASGASLFSGCYFAATGNSPDRQAFVKSALEKMVQLEGELHWSDSALAEDDRYDFLAQIAMVLNIVFLIAIGVLLIFIYPDS